ncbi:MAG TPA: hypothetical protein VFB60_26625 [Ktedonobacteraceae bacterium]|nr:hypothetical protein [Ktedonobacteraceae bacterium]
MLEKMSKSSMGMRAQEFHEGLKDTINFPLKDMYMEKTLLVGKAATLATHLKGRDYIEDYQTLKGLASQLGISGIELRHVLRELEEIDFATVREANSQIKRVELRIPELRNGYEDLGERWIQLCPSEIEQASIEALETVAAFPQHEANLKNSLGLSGADFNKVLMIANSGLLIDQYKNENEVILYSPLTVEEKPAALLTLAQQFPEDRIILALGGVQRYQGVPMEQLIGTDKEFATQAMRLGALCPVQVTAGATGRTFLFTPRGGLAREERIILEKARAILACVRYGEHYASTRKIIYPELILETLRERKRFKYPRPDFPEQYGLLVIQQIGTVEPDRWRPGFYHFSLIDTPENMRALDIAIDLLKLGRISASKLEVDAAALLNVSGTFSGTLPTRAKLGREVALPDDIARNYILNVAKLTRGVDK